MNSLKIIFFILIYCGCKTGHDNSFNSQVKELFFNADVTANYQSVLGYYRSLDNLSELEPLGWTVYPPLSALGQGERDTSFRSFQFDNNPALPSEFGRGRINIKQTHTGSSTSSEFVMFFVFKSRFNAEEAYNAAVRKFLTLQVDKKDLHFDDMKVSEFYGHNDKSLGILLSLDDGDPIVNGYAVTMSLIPKHI